MELSRRRFMQFLSAAPVALAFDPHRKIFDMGRSQIWTPSPPEIIPAVMGDWIELGPHIDFSINAVLAQYGQKITEQAIEAVPSHLYTWDIPMRSKWSARTSTKD
jgi:hypothetical protein